jgi:hypothetical protein
VDPVDVEEPVVEEPVVEEPVVEEPVVEEPVVEEPVVEEPVVVVDPVVDEVGAPTNPLGAVPAVMDELVEAVGVAAVLAAEEPEKAAVF